MYSCTWLTNVFFRWFIHLPDGISEWTSCIHNTFSLYVKFFPRNQISHMSSTNSFFLSTFHWNTISTNLSSVVLVQLACIRFSVKDDRCKSKHITFGRGVGRSWEWRVRGWVLSSFPCTPFLFCNYISLLFLLIGTGYTPHMWMSSGGKYDYRDKPLPYMFATCIQTLKPILQEGAMIDCHIIRLYKYVKHNFSVPSHLM